MKHSDSLPSQLKIAAEVDAALAQAGLAGPQVEREAIPLYLSFVFELTGFQQVEPQLNWNSQKLALHLESWLEQEKSLLIDTKLQLSAIFEEVLELCKVHGTLSDFKRREIQRFHSQVIDFLEHPSLMGKRPSKSL